MKKQIKKQPKEEVVLKKITYYAVSENNHDTVDMEGLWLFDTIEDAYKDYVNDYGTQEPAYVYKIEYMGEISMELIIK
jgi:hypothetical protein